MNRLLNAEELAEFLGIARSSVYHYTKRGLPVVKVGKHFRYDPVVVLEYLRHNSDL